MGSVPDWVAAGGALGQAAAEAGQLYVSVIAARRSARREFARLLDEALGSSADGFSGLFDDQRLALLLGQAADAAERTASDQKRRMLAGIVTAAAYGAFDDAEVDPVPFLLRTVDAIEPAHLRVLLLTALPRYPAGLFWGGSHFGVVDSGIVQALWPGAAGMAEPLLSGLELHNLVERERADTRAYRVTPFGRLLLRFQEPMLDLTRAYITAAVDRDRSDLIVRNTGMTRAWDVVVNSTPVGDLHPEQEQIVPFAVPAPPFDLAVGWTDDRGKQVRRLVVNHRPLEPRLTLDIPFPTCSV
jgi:hypothetical protein